LLFMFFAFIVIGIIFPGWLVACFLITIICNFYFFNLF
jgi:hypothetical protein